MIQRHSLHHCQQGATLIELIITIVIISVALTGVLSVMNISTRHSADPVIQQQAIAIAESYLEEILLLPVTDPDGINIGETRATFDNIDDYNGLINNGVIDQHGNTIAATLSTLDLLGNSITQVTGSLQKLANYVISVTVVDEVISGITFKKVTVNVSRANVTISLSGYRTVY